MKVGSLMKLARLFEELLHELQKLIASQSEYDLIKSSKILRQLLMDGDALLHLVNRELRSSPIFRVRTLTETPQSSNWVIPELYCVSDDTPCVNLNLQQFLGYRMGMTNGSEITIRQVIKYAAIILGGVHFKVDKGGEYEGIAQFHANPNKSGITPILTSLRDIGAITRDALIPIRDLLIKREKFENGKGWTALLCLELLPSPPDEDNFILDLGANESNNRFSIYVDARSELTFRIIDRNGVRKYLRAGAVGEVVPVQKPIVIACELSTIGHETLISLRTEGWDHVEVVDSFDYQEVGNPFHAVTGSDCFGKKHTHIFVYGELLIAKPLTALELAQTAQHLLSRALESEVGLHYRGNQFMYSAAHPNFPALIEKIEI